MVHQTGEPSRFTWDDVELVRAEGDRLAAEYHRLNPSDWEREMNGDQWGIRQHTDEELHELWSRAERYRSLADRIAATLTPRSPG